MIWATFFTLAGVWWRTRPYYWDNSPDEEDEEVFLMAAYVLVGGRGSGAGAGDPSPAV